jgi:hypothetical protein
LNLARFEVPCPYLNFPISLYDGETGGRRQATVVAQGDRIDDSIRTGKPARCTALKRNDIKEPAKPGPHQSLSTGRVQRGGGSEIPSGVFEKDTAALAEARGKRPEAYRTVTGSRDHVTAVGCKGN